MTCRKTDERQKPAERVTAYGVRRTPAALLAPSPAAVSVSRSWTRQITYTRARIEVRYHAIENEAGGAQTAEVGADRERDLHETGDANSPSRER